MIGIGTLANTAAIVVGGVLGSFVIPRVPDKMKETIMRVLGLAVLVIGIQMALTSKELLLIIISLAAGAAIGEAIRIEDRLENQARRLEKLMGTRTGDFAATFVRISLLFCVGAMAITGSFEDGLNHNPSILFAKAMLDGIGSIIFASVMGPAVIMTAVPVLLYQGSLTLGAAGLQSVMTPSMVNELAACGGILVMAIGLNLTEAVRVRVGNLLPALLLIPLLVALKDWLLPFLM
jgi:uncharacterized membrane protein YqgA involved in biofilm formation